MKFLKFFAPSFFLIFSLSCSEREGKSEDSTKKETKNAQPEALNYDCRNCGMPSNEYPKWNVVLVSDQEKIHFCSPRCFFQIYLDQKHKPQNIQTIQLIDYYELQKFDAKKAFFVIGSKITGPMGNDFVPHKSRDAAEEFKKDHEGKAIYTFEEIKPDILKKVLMQ